MHSVGRTSVLFVSISFIVLMVISLAWLVFYYIQRFRYIHAKDRLSVRTYFTTGRLPDVNPPRDAVIVIIIIIVIIVIVVIIIVIGIIVIIIISSSSSSSLFMSPLLTHRPYLMDYTEGERAITYHAECGLVGGNDCKCSRDQRLDVPAVAWRSTG
jgi:hypothetical protein